MKRRKSDEEREYAHWQRETGRLARRLERLRAEYQTVRAKLARLRDQIAETERALNAAEYEQESAGAYLSGEV